MFNEKEMTDRKRSLNEIVQDAPTNDDLNGLLDWVIEMTSSEINNHQTFVERIEDHCEGMPKEGDPDYEKHYYHMLQLVAHLEYRVVFNKCREEMDRLKKELELVTESIADG